MMNIEMWLGWHLLDQFENSATPINKYDYGWCTNIIFNHVLESYIHIVLRRENLEAMTDNDFTFDKVEFTCISVHKQDIDIFILKHR